MTAANDARIDADLGHDIAVCDREPIHVPGAIQPHGLLLVVDAASFRVVAGAGALEERLSPDWLDVPADVLLHQDVAAALADADVGPGGTLALAPVAGPAERFSAALHRAGELLLIELEPIGDEQPAGAVLAWLDATATAFERAADLGQLCERAAAAFRQLTGFDRVMLYRFLDDDTGCVCGESKADGLHSFLRHHFPASDIPRQARALYVRNRTRAIPDIAYAPAPLRPAAFAATDLSDVALRSVSPVHLRYLANMGVQASASISIVRDGVLWGLVACHHTTARTMDAATRATAQALAGGLARQIRAREEAERYRERIRLRAGEDAILGRLDGRPLGEAFDALAPELMRLLDADGVALVRGSSARGIGTAPDAAALGMLADWTAQVGGGEVWATRTLPAQFPPAEHHAAGASGVVALPLDREDGTLLWFRREEVEQVNWAGNPHKAVALQPGETLTPRASFESWSQEVRGRARRWTLEEVEAAARLRRMLHEQRQAARLRQLNAKLAAAVDEKDALLRQKDVLMHEVNHRVQNSLQLVSSFLQMQARSVGDPVLTGHLTEAQARLAAVAQVHRRLYRDDHVGAVDLGRYLEDLVGDVKASLGEAWAGAMRADLSPVLVPTDRAVSIGLILTELVINATKYAYPGGSGPIDVVLEQHGARLRLVVADQGRGKQGDGQGFGSRMMQAMVRQLDGEMELENNRPGLRAVLMAPIEAPPR